MSQDLLEQKELWNVGAGATTTTIPMVTQSGLSVALSAFAQTQLAGSIFDCTIGATRCIAIVNNISTSGVLTLDSALPSAPAQGTQFVLTPTDQTSLSGNNSLPPISVTGTITVPASSTYISPKVVTTNQDWTIAKANVKVTTTATPNYTLVTRLDVDGIGSGSNNWNSPNVNVTTGSAGIYYTSDANGVTVLGGCYLYFTLLNNDATNSITLNRGQVNVH